MRLKERAFFFNTKSSAKIVIKTIQNVELNIMKSQSNL